MSNRPPISWSSALRELKADRLTRQPVREERLRQASRLAGSPALALSAWRGASGRRYVTSIRPIADFDAVDASGSVVLFVSRDTDGFARIVLGARDAGAAELTGMADLARRSDCNEVHIHRLAGSASERLAIIGDLNVIETEVAL